MFLVIIIGIVAVIVLVKILSDRAEKEKVEREKIERQKRIENEEKIKAQKYAIITEGEKQKLIEAGGEQLLKDTVGVFDLAVKDDVKAMILMGLTYDTKLNVPVKAAYWIEKASKLGDVDATYILGTYYADGYGVKKDRKYGVGLIYNAAKKGNKDAINSLQKNIGMSKEEMRKWGIPV